MQRRILIADDDAAQRRYLASILRAGGANVEQAEGGEAALAAVFSGGPRIDAMLLDINMPDMSGMEVLQKLRPAKPDLPVLILTSDGSVSRAVEAMRAGATDFLVKPVAPERLAVSLDNACALSALSTEVRRLARQEENRLSFSELVCASPATRDAIKLARRAAGSDIPVLVEGESGVGKEVFARAIHGESERAGGPFVAVNCGAIPENLVESILFGHEKGAFTGAFAKRVGKFQEAHGGTLFLDEVGELPLEAQVKLLRAIQTGEIDPVGGSRPVTVDIRLISATNRDMREMVAKGRFREDLYYRIGVFPLTLPPLRDRWEDLPELARMFLNRLRITEQAPVTDFSQDALDLICAADWPGNVRQLENTIHRAVVLADSQLIRPRDLHGLAAANTGAVPGTPDPAPQPVNGSAHPLPDAVAAQAGEPDPFVAEDGHIRRLIEIEADAIGRALELYRGRMSETARRLGIGRSTLYRKIDELRIDHPRN